MSGSSTALERRTCNGVRKDGQPCRATAVADDGFCFAHGSSPELLAEVRRKAGVRSGETRREQAKSVRDRLREKVEEEFEKVWQAFADSLEAVTPDGAKDFRARCAAAQAVLIEAYGRPAQAIIGDVDKPLQFILQSAFGETNPHALEEGDEA